MEDYVWYAVYGSNYYSKRFKLYLQGGKISGYTRLHEGSRDQSPPLKSTTIKIPYATFFSQKAHSWEGKGVAFLDSKLNSGTSYSRIYLIKKSQFIDVFAQENGLSPIGFKEKIDWSIDEHSSCNIGEEDELLWYGKLMRLSDVHGIPVFSFTAKPDDFQSHMNKPGVNYLAIIMAGLAEMKLSSEQQIDYLLKVAPLNSDDFELIQAAKNLSLTME